MAFLFFIKSLGNAPAETSGAFSIFIFWNHRFFMIKLIGLHKVYHSHIALENVHLSIEAGEIFGIIGKSGAGKSTLLRCINLLERPDAGEVWVDGEALLKLSAKSLRSARHKIGMVFQHFNLLSSKTVYDNIALPLRIQGMNEDKIQERVNELLFLVELKDKKTAYPAQLSGGQKQRVAIARALACSPKVLLCDEATSALDPETTASILALLKKINHVYGITMILITHEMEVVKQLCHRVALMEAGRLVEITALSEVFKFPKSRIRQLLYAQLTPHLPSYLVSKLTLTPNDKPVLRLLFQGDVAAVPFISQTSRNLNIDINILLANLEHIDAVTFGVLVVELLAPVEVLPLFIERCQALELNVEVLGYVTESVV